MQPELLRMSELNDNNDLASRASLLLTRTCGVSPPREMITLILNEFFKAIQESPVRISDTHRSSTHLLLVVEDPPESASSSPRLVSMKEYTAFRTVQQFSTSVNCHSSATSRLSES